MSNILEQLEDLKGSTFTLGEWDNIDKKKYILNRFVRRGVTTVLHTNIKAFNILNSELSEFFSHIKISESSKAEFKPNTSKIMDLAPKKVDLTIFEPTETQKKVQQSLVDMLGKVMAGEKGSIEKAKSVVDISNAMVNMEKSQIQLLQLASKNKY